MKNLYITPEIEVVNFDMVDVITSSGGLANGGTYDGDGNDGQTDLGDLGLSF